VILTFRVGDALPGEGSGAPARGGSCCCSFRLEFLRGARLPTLTPKFSQDSLQRLFRNSGPRKPSDWIGPTILAFYWRLRWPAVGLENIALTASTSSVFLAEVDVGQSAHDTYPTGEMPLSPLHA